MQKISNKKYYDFYPKNNKDLMEVYKNDLSNLKILSSCHKSIKFLPKNLSKSNLSKLEHFILS